MRDWCDDPSHHEWTLLPRSYISVPSTKVEVQKYIKFYIFLSRLLEEKKAMPFIPIFTLEFTKFQNI